MKKTIFSGIFTIVLALLAGSANAQACPDFQTKNCKASSPESGYQYNAASRSGLLFKGQTSEFKFDIHQGKDYRIAICAESQLGTKINMQIFDGENNSLLYDNKDYQYSTEFEFQVKESRSVRVVISVPNDEKASGTSKGLKPKTQNLGCIGVLIESMVTPKTGF